MRARIASRTALVCLLSTVARPAPGTPQENAPEHTRMARAVTVPFDMTIGKIVVEARINGRGPYRLLLDTGASVTTLDQDLAQELGLQSTGQQQLGSPLGDQRLTVDTHALDRVAIGDAVFENVRAVAWDRSGLYGGDDAPRGVLGFPLFADCILKIDYPRRRIVLDPEPLTDELRERATPFTFDPRGNIPVIDVSIGGERVATHIDTGAPGGLKLPARFQKTLPLADEPMVVGRGRTVDAEFEIRAATYRGDLTIAGLKLENPRLEFIDNLNHGNIGSTLLRDATVTFDQRTRRLLIEADPGGRSADELRARMNGRFRVTGQLWAPPGAPAEELSGEATFSPAFNGRYIREEFTLSHRGSQLAGEAFSTRTVDGDFELVQVDGFNPLLVHVRGPWNADAGEIRMESAATEGFWGHTLRWVYRAASDDRGFVKEVYVRAGEEDFRLVSRYTYEPIGREDE